jgi:hypothetical protein
MIARRPSRADSESVMAGPRIGQGIRQQPPATTLKELRGRRRQLLTRIDQRLKRIAERGSLVSLQNIDALLDLHERRM